MTSSYFNHPEWARYAPGLKTIEDATRIRARILLSFERGERSDVKGDLTRSLTFVVVGGGPTGVELAGSIADIAHNSLAGDFRNINPEKARIILIEAGPVILKGSLLKFAYRVFRASNAREGQLLLAEGETVHIVCDASMQRCLMPERYAAPIRSAIRFTDRDEQQDYEE